MALRERRHFDIEAAAEYLGCSISDLRYYLDEGELRFAFPTEEIIPFDAIVFDELPQGVQDSIFRLSDPGPPDKSDFEKIKLQRKEPHHYNCPEFLYISGYHRKKTLERIGESGRGIYYFETLEGQLVNIWDYGSLSYWWVYPREDGELSDTILPREELDRLAPKPKPKKQFSEAKVDVSDDQPAYAAPPKKPNEASLLIVEYANKYCLEYKKHPKPSVFAKYLSVHASHEGFRIRTKEEMNRGQNAHEKRKYDFNGYGISERSLAKRLRDYRIKK